jgi:uncharacterized membrane protein
MDDLDAHSSTHRLEAFSDGVLAIAITLLIIEIAVPHIEGDGSLGEKIGELWPSYFAYALSFITIGIYWANHHSFTLLFRRTNHQFLILNVMFLMAIAFLPFPTAVLGEYLKEDVQRGDAVTFYAFGLALPAAAWCILWIYGRWQGLLLKGLDPAYLRFMTLQYLFSVVIYSSAIIVSLIEPWAGLAICTGLTGLYLLPPRQPVFEGEDGSR